MLREKPIIRIKVDVWYGFDTEWKTTLGTLIGTQYSPPVGRAIYFSRIWQYHVNEKNRLGIKGPYKSIIDSRTGVRDGFKTQGKDQETGGGAKVVQLSDYRASRNRDKG